MNEVRFLPPAGMRLARIKGFPFKLVYRATADEVIVVAVAHDRRQPDNWRGRAV